MNFACITLLYSETKQQNATDDVVACSHTVNLLTNMPRESFEELLTPANDDSPTSEACASAVTACDEAVYDGKNMDAVIEMLSFLHARLDTVSTRHTM